MLKVSTYFCLTKLYTGNYNILVSSLVSALISYRLYRIEKETN